MLPLSVLPLPFFNYCIYMTFSNLLVFFIIDWFVVFGRVQQSEINQGCFFINRSYYWCLSKIIWENWKILVFFICRFYIYFTRVFCKTLLNLWRIFVKKSFVKLGYCSILVISLNILFASARCLHKYRVLLIEKILRCLKYLFLKTGCYWFHSNSIFE